MMEAAGSFKILLLIYQTIWHHIPQYSNLDVHCHGNLKFCKICFDLNEWLTAVWKQDFIEKTQKTWGWRREADMQEEEDEEKEEQKKENEESKKYDEHKDEQEKKK